MNYYKSEIVLQEVPNEISLCFSICGCKIRCNGCHSPFLWKETNGIELTLSRFISHIERYDGMITCVLFMGGEWHLMQLIEMLDYCKKKGLKTCLYSGQEYVNIALLKKLDYVKTGKWISQMGGLNSPETNQRFIEVATCQNLNYLFQKKQV